jgi:hypothetical protein
LAVASSRRFMLPCSYFRSLQRAICGLASLVRRFSHVTRHTSHVTRHTSHVTRHTSHVTPHTSHATRHTSHVTRHTHTSQPNPETDVQASIPYQNPSSILCNRLRCVLRQRLACSSVSRRRFSHSKCMNLGALTEPPLCPPSCCR